LTILLPSADELLKLENSKSFFCFSENN